jgi:hypothetical protein
MRTATYILTALTIALLAAVPAATAEEPALTVCDYYADGAVDCYPDDGQPALIDREDDPLQTCETWEGGRECVAHDPEPDPPNEALEESPLVDSYLGSLELQAVKQRQTIDRLRAKVKRLRHLLRSS